jgi:hypothetical protein
MLIALMQTPRPTSSPTPALLQGPTPVPGTPEYLSPPSIVASGSLTPNGYEGFATVVFSSSSGFVNYTLNGGAPACNPGDLRPPSTLMLAMTSQVTPRDFKFFYTASTQEKTSILCATGKCTLEFAHGLSMHNIQTTNPGAI